MRPRRHTGQGEPGSDSWSCSGSGSGSGAARTLRIRAKLSGDPVQWAEHFAQIYPIASWIRMVPPR